MLQLEQNSGITGSFVPETFGSFDQIFFFRAMITFAKRSLISHVALRIFLSGWLYPKVFRAVKIRTSANYRFARKSSSRGPNAALLA